MGSSNRDYFRDEDLYGSSWEPGGNTPKLSIEKKVAIAIGLGFLVSVLFEANLDWFAVSRESLLSGRIWTPLTYPLVNNPFHIIGVIFDCYLMVAFGSMMRRSLGEGEFLRFLVATALFGAVCQLIATGTPTVGSTHLVLAMLVWLALSSPHLRLNMILFEAPIWVLVMVFVALGLFGAIRSWQMALTVPPDQGPYFDTMFPSLLGALLFAFMYEKLRWNLTSLTGSLASSGRGRRRGLSNPFAGLFRRRRQLRVYSPETEAAQARQEEDTALEVDRILQKIHEQGEASLTNKERKFLAKESQRLREKR